MRAEKNYLIQEVETHLKKSDYVILTNFAKVTVADAAELRKRLDVEKAEFHVVKNSSLRVAAKTLRLPELESALTGPRSSRWRQELRRRREDSQEILRSKQKLEVKVGIVDKKIVTASDLAKIADLPSFEALRSQLLGLFMQNAASRPCPRRQGQKGAACCSRGLNVFSYA